MLQHFEKVLVDLTPSNDGVYSNGVWIADEDDPSEIEVVIPQPVTMQEIVILPEGQHIKNFVKTWTESELKVNDKITYNEKEFLVYQVDTRFEGNFYRVILREITSDE